MGGMKNRYRQIGDAVPPLVAYQLSACVGRMEQGFNTEPEDHALEMSCMAPKNRRDFRKAA
jgi:DNA (cytosine-5)-methyltransferase 1